MFSDSSDVAFLPKLLWPLFCKLLLRDLTSNSVAMYSNRTFGGTNMRSGVQHFRRHRWKAISPISIDVTVTWSVL